MPDATPPTSKPIELFISYVTEDSEISDALNNVLNDTFGNDLKVFLDKVAIQQGADLRIALGDGCAPRTFSSLLARGTTAPPSTGQDTNLGSSRLVIWSSAKTVRFGATS